MARGAAVVPDVSFRTDGGLSPQSTVEPAASGMTSEVRFAGDVLFRQRCGGYDSVYVANFQSRIALSLADGLVKRKNDELLARTRNKDGWPILVVANLHRPTVPAGNASIFV